MVVYYIYQQTLRIHEAERAIGMSSSHRWGRYGVMEGWRTRFGKITVSNKKGEEA